MTWAHARQVPGTAASKGVRIRGYRFRRGCVEGFPGTDPTPGLRADIFRPQGRMGPNEPCHQLLAPRVLLQSGGVLVRLWDGFDVMDVNPEFGSGVGRHDCPPGLQRVSGRVALSERSQRRRVICEASPSGHATERTTSPPPARYCAGDGDAVSTDSQDAVGRAWSGDRSSVAVGNCGAS